MIRSVVCPGVLGLVLLASGAAAQDVIEYRVLATNKTSTMEKEMNEAAADGFRFGAVMGGETSFGGAEVVVVMMREPGEAPRFRYRLLATNKTSTMERELQQEGDVGYEYRGQTVFKSMFGGKEVVVLLERDANVKDRGRVEYRLMAAKKTGTLERELAEAGRAGYQVVGMTVADTLVGGSEVVAILRRKIP